MEGTIMTLINFVKDGTALVSIMGMGYLAMLVL